VLARDTMVFNPKPGKPAPMKNNRLKYFLGKLFPSLFGQAFHFQGTLYDEFGRVKAIRHVYNTVTTGGKNAAMDQLLAAPTLGKPTHMAVGTGSPAANALGTELDRNALTSKTRSNAVVTMQGDWAAGDGTGALTEAGVFDASSAGNMHLSVSFSVVNKAAADTFSIVWTWTGA
jgi:hypothetical protein